VTGSAIERGEQLGGVVLVGEGEVGDLVAEPVDQLASIAGEASAILHVRAQDTPHLEEALERIRDTPGIIRTQTQVVLSTLFERPVAG
jgi:hypothetical protein